MTDVVNEFGKAYCKEKVPELKPGYLVEVHQKIKEGNKERTQVFKGTVIKVNAGYGVNDNFTVRKISDKIGVEKTFPIHSPNIIKIDIQRAQKVRRAKLLYLRDLSGKALRLKEIPLKLKEKLFPKAEEKVSTEASSKELEASESTETKEATV